MSWVLLLLPHSLCKSELLFSSYLFPIIKFLVFRFASGNRKKALENPKDKDYCKMRRRQNSITFQILPAWESWLYLWLNFPIEQWVIEIAPLADLMFNATSVHSALHRPAAITFYYRQQSYTWKNDAWWEFHFFSNEKLSFNHSYNQLF